jgi:hypothetical protein
MIGACRPAFVGLWPGGLAKPISKRLPAAPPDAGIQVFAAPHIDESRQFPDGWNSRDALSLGKG